MSKNEEIVSTAVLWWVQHLSQEIKETINQSGKDSYIDKYNYLLESLRTKRHLDDIRLFMITLKRLLEVMQSIQSEKSFIVLSNNEEVNFSAIFKKLPKEKLKLLPQKCIMFIDYKYYFICFQYQGSEFFIHPKRSK